MNFISSKTFTEADSLGEWFPVLGKNARIENSPGSTKPTKRIILTSYDDFRDLKFAWAAGSLPIGDGGMPIIPGYFGGASGLPLPSAFSKADRERFVINVAFGTAIAGGDEDEVFKFYPPEKAKSVLVQLAWPNATDAKSLRRAQSISKNLSNVAWSRTVSVAADEQCCFILLKKTPAWQPTYERAQIMINELINAGKESIDEYCANLGENRAMMHNLAGELNELTGMSADFEESSSPSGLDELVVYFGDKGCRVAATAKNLRNLYKYIKLHKESAITADVINFLACLGRDD